MSSVRCIKGTPEGGDPGEWDTVTEAQFMQQVIDLARLRGWKVAHFRTARIQRKDGSVHYATPVQADGAGWPDLVLCRPPRLLFIELKSDKGRASPEQLEWMALLASSEQETHIWRPKDWDAIEAALR